MELMEPVDVYNVERIADLATNLPPGSRALAKEDPRSEWGWTEWLLSDISYHTRLLVWAKTKDAQRGFNQPTPILPSSPKEEVTTMTSDDYMEKLQQNRWEVT